MRCKLTELKPGTSGCIVSITLHGPMRHRLQDLGFLPGTMVVMRLCGWGGGIRAYEIHDSLIALRQEDAERILVNV